IHFVRNDYDNSLLLVPRYFFKQITTPRQPCDSPTSEISKMKTLEKKEFAEKNKIKITKAFQTKAKEEPSIISNSTEDPVVELLLRDQLDTNDTQALFTETLFVLERENANAVGSRLRFRIFRMPLSAAEQNVYLNYMKKQRPH